MTKASQRIFSVEFKLEAVRRMEAGVNVSGLAQELCVLRKDLYRWRAQVRAGAPMLGKPGRPAGAASVVSDGGGATSNEDELAQARSRIAELERKIGQQQIDLDFFRHALRHVREPRRATDASGATRSTPKSGQ